MKKEKVKALPKGVSEQFADSLNNMLIDDLKAVIVRLQLENQENEEFKESEAFVKAKAEYDIAKERFDLVAGPVKDLTTSIKNRTKLVIERLRNKGGA